MPITYNYSKTNDKYAQLYRLLGLLMTNTSITADENEKMVNEVVNELLRIRDKLYNDTTINTSLTDVII